MRLGFQRLDHARSHELIREIKLLISKNILTADYIFLGKQFILLMNVVWREELISLMHSVDLDRKLHYYCYKLCSYSEDTLNIYLAEAAQCYLGTTKRSQEMETSSTNITKTNIIINVIKSLNTRPFRCLEARTMEYIYCSPRPELTN